VTEALTVANTAVADGYSEGLDATVDGGVTGNLLGASGSTGDIAAGGNSTALGVSISTAAAGTVSGSVDVALTSDGTGVDTLGRTQIGTRNGAWSYLVGGTLLSTSSSGSNFARWDKRGHP
jgi:hypothetical protein